jgi:hypothetical protein
MRITRRRTLALLIGPALLVSAAGARAQDAAAPAAKDGKAGKAGKAPKEPKPQGETKVPKLFQSESPLALTLTLNVKQIRRDKGENPPWRPATITYTDSANKPAEIPLRVRTRGIWRLKTCTFPPLRMNFSGKDTKHTLFDDLEKPKLVNYCKDLDEYNQYILRELQLYRVYQLLTPISHRVRLAKIAYIDSASKKREAERYAIIEEDPDQLANRLSGQLLKTNGAGVADFEPPQLALTYLFEYFIGNLDFSFMGLHNTELLLTSNGQLFPIAYDFDFAGAVNTPYAAPPPNYGIRSVRERKFIGPCGVAEEYPKAVALFQQKKDAIYALYRDEVGQLMDRESVGETLRYFDEFYEAIKSPRDVQRNIIDRCVGPH